MIGLRTRICGKSPTRISRYISILSYMVICLTIFVVIFNMLFHDIEGWDFVTSLYFTVVTMTTIGFGDYGMISKHHLLIMSDIFSKFPIFSLKFRFLAKFPNWQNSHIGKIRKFTKFQNWQNSQIGKIPKFPNFIIKILRLRNYF